MGGKVSTYAINRSGLNTILAKLYPTVEKTKQFMKRVELDTNRLNFDLGPETYWHDILVRADRNKNTQAIINKASQDHEDCADELAKAYQVYKESRKKTLQGDFVGSGDVGSISRTGIAIGKSSGVMARGNIVSADKIGGFNPGGIKLGEQIQIGNNSSPDEEE